MQSEVRVGAHRSIVILEGTGIALRGGSSLGRLMEWSIGQETDITVRSGLGPVSSWLRGARVLGVDETAVGANLIWCSASSIGGDEGVGVGPANWRAGSRSCAGG